MAHGCQWECHWDPDWVLSGFGLDSNGVLAGFLLDSNAFKLDFNGTTMRFQLDPKVICLYLLTDSYGNSIGFW